MHLQTPNPHCPPRNGITLMNLTTLLSHITRLFILISIFVIAYTIRLGAVNKYGRIIHEFDPWFNFRATKYLVDNGWEAFSTWYDYESWYPIGRPVGTTLYPGYVEL